MLSSTKEGRSVSYAVRFGELCAMLRKLADAPAILPEHDAVVFDEAHRLEESRIIARG